MGGNAVSDGADPPAEVVGGSVAPGGAKSTVAESRVTGSGPRVEQGQLQACDRHSAGSALEARADSPEGDSAACGVCVPGGLGILLGAAVLGGAGVWLYLRLSHSAEHHASHRIDELRQRLDQLTHQFAEYTAKWERPSTGAESA